MTEPNDPPARPRRLRLPHVVPVIAAVVLLADQVSKVIAVETLTGRGRVDLVGDLFGLRLIRNPGAAFSLATGATWILTLVALVVVVAIVRISRQLGSRGWTVALGLLLGGALGNLSDRLFREPGFFRGHVVDFLELPNYPIFNLADSCIVTAAVLIAVLSLRGIGVDGSRASAPAPAGSTDGSPASSPPGPSSADVSSADVSSADVSSADVSSAGASSSTGASATGPSSSTGPSSPPGPSSSGGGGPA